MLLFILSWFWTTIFIDPLVSVDLKKNGTADIICILHSQHSSLLATTDLFESKELKGEYVYNKLYEQALHHQKDIKKYLVQNKYKHRSFYIINAIHIPQADQKVIDYLSSLQNVIRIEQNSNYKLQSYAQQSTDLLSLEVRNPQAIQWGISKIKADSLWALGIKGQGVVIGGEDTGVELHPLVKPSYRGSLTADRFDHNYNWHDAIHSLHPLNRDTSTNEYNNPCGLDTVAPCDDDNHGTHTVGTIAATGMEIGIAPEAKWIACRCMERGWGTLATYIECFEWFLAPTDTLNKNPNPKLAPHVINNSWGCPPEEGCNASNFATMDQVIKNLKAAGIVVVASAGNSGAQGCSTIDDPAAIFEASFTVGASNSGDSIAGFSSKGPVLVDGSARLKPNIVAPGVGVLSTIRRNAFASFNGTSMAGPHVAGAIALLLNAYPALKGKVDLIETILEQSAHPITPRILCGTDMVSSMPNNTYGHGRLDIYKAFVLANRFLSTPTKENPLSYTIRVFPNPTSDILYIQSKNETNILAVSIYSIDGKKVFSTKEKSTHLSFHLNTLPGMYILQILTDKGVLIKNIIKR